MVMSTRKVQLSSPRQEPAHPVTHQSMCLSLLDKVTLRGPVTRSPEPASPHTPALVSSGHKRRPPHAGPTHIADRQLRAHHWCQMSAMVLRVEKGGRLWPVPWLLSGVWLPFGGFLKRVLGGPACPLQAELWTHISPKHLWAGLCNIADPTPLPTCIHYWPKIRMALEEAPPVLYPNSSRSGLSGPQLYERNPHSTQVGLPGED